MFITLEYIFLHLSLMKIVRRYKQVSFIILLYWNVRHPFDSNEYFKKDQK